jgi:hypothetical protein
MSALLTQPASTAAAATAATVASAFMSLDLTTDPPLVCAGRRSHPA